MSCRVRSGFAGTDAQGATTEAGRRDEHEQAKLEESLHFHPTNGRHEAAGRRQRPGGGGQIALRRFGGVGMRQVGRYG